MTQRTRGGWAGTELVLLALILGLVAFVVLPAYIKGSVADDIRRCYAVQKRLDAAVDAFESDTGTHVTALDPVFGELIQRGYLSERPIDPGDDRPASCAHYGRNARGAIYCWVHGSAWDPRDRPARFPEPPVRTFGPARPWPPPPPTGSPQPIMIKKVPGFYR